MEKLKLRKIDGGNRSLTTIEITGFMPGKLNELKSMEHRESLEKIVEMLNDRNENVGTCYACGYGIYEHWFDNEAAYINIGNTCD